MLKNLYDLDVIQSDNYRKIDPKIVDSLVVSILEIGLQEPIRLFQIEETGELFMISGHHRLEAMRKIKRNPLYQKKVFQAYVMRGSQKEYLSQETAIKSVMANSLRPDISLVDRAGALLKLVQVGLSLEDIAKMLNEERLQVQKLLAVATLPEDVRDFIHEHPRLKDSVVIKFALRYEQDQSFQIIEAFQEVLGRKRQGASSKLNRRNFRERLEATGEFNAQQILKIMDCVDEIGKV